jgi:hypothetical protein
MSLKQSMPIGALGLILAGASGSALAQYSSPVRNVENPDRFPYQETASATMPTPFLNGFASFPTPTGKRYIIEFASLVCTTPSASDTFPQALLGVIKMLSVSSAQFFNVVNIPMQRQGAAPFGGYVWSGAAQLKAYSDYSPFDPTGGYGIQMNIFHTDVSVVASCNGVVTGHTITP